MSSESSIDPHDGKNQESESRLKSITLEHFPVPLIPEQEPNFKSATGREYTQQQLPPLTLHRRNHSNELLFSASGGESSPSPNSPLASVPNRVSTPPPLNHSMYSSSLTTTRVNSSAAYNQLDQKTNSNETLTRASSASPVSPGDVVYPLKATSGSIAHSRQNSRTYSISRAVASNENLTRSRSNSASPVSPGDVLYPLKAASDSATHSRHHSRTHSMSRPVIDTVTFMRASENGGEISGGGLPSAKIVRC